MMKEFRQAMQRLADNEALFQSGERSAFDHAYYRESYLVVALCNLAKLMGAKLAEPIRIDARGEMCLFAEKGTTYGAQFSEFLNGFQTRTGIVFGAKHLPESAWCLANHFEVERMVKKFVEAAEPATA